MSGLSREEGQGLVEYAFIILLIAIVVIVALLAFGPMIANLYSNVLAQFPDV